MWTPAILCALIATTGHAQEMTFYFTGNGGNCLGCEFVEASGEITANTPARFAAFADSLGGRGTLALDSTGGDPAAAMALGRLIRERGWGTDRSELGTPSGAEPARPTDCAQECLLAFMGGTARDVVPGFDLTVIGAGADPWVSVEVLAYTLEMGIAAEVLTLAANAPIGETYVFDPADHDRLGLDNTTITNEAWYLEPYKEGLVLATKQRYGPDWAVSFTLFCRVEDPRWHILYVEPGDFSIFAFPNDTPFNFLDNPGRFGPQFRIGEDVYPLTPDDVDFVRQTDTGMTVSLRLPDAVVDQAGADLSFTPNLSRVFGGVLNFTVPLPRASWMDITKRNCV